MDRLKIDLLKSFKTYYFFKPRVFTTVVSGLGEFFSPGREAKITTSYISEVSIKYTCCELALL